MQQPPYTVKVANEARPQAERDYPGSWQAFERWFPNEEACVEYLGRVRWRDGFSCPACGHDQCWHVAGRRLMCRRCGRKTSATAGTIFHRSHLPLRSWFAAMWFICAQKHGVSALGLQRVLGFGSYQTAWAWMHKLRRAMVRPDRDLLGGPGRVVEMDCTFIGGRTPGMDTPRYFNKAEVVIAVEYDPNHRRRLGRVRMAVIDRTRRKLDILAFTQMNVLVGSTLRTDGDRLYNDLAEKAWMKLDQRVIEHSGYQADQLLPGVHRVASLLKRWLAGTIQNGLSASQLQYYLDEFTFRFNRRTSRDRGLLWYRLVQQAVRTDPHPYHELIASPSAY